MIFLDELKNLKMYNKQFMFINEKNKLKNAAMILLTPDLVSSANCINSNLINSKYYKSYYLEKDISVVLNSDMKLVKEEFIEEKYHLNSPKSVHRSVAIRTRRGINKNKHNKEDLETLSDPELENPEPDAIKKDREDKGEEKLNVPTLAIDIPEPDTTHSPTPASTPAKESTIMENCFCFQEGSHEGYIRNGNNILIINEDSVYDGILKKALYKERFKSNKEVIQKYNEIKEVCPSIQYTYTTISKYKEKNLFIDLSYYNQAYFSNSLYKNKKGYSIYNDLMTRLIKSTSFSEYTHRVVLIPVLDWSRDKSKRLWMYVDEITPISIIYESLKTNYAKFKEDYKDLTFVFLGNTNYFKFEVNSYTPQNLQLFKRLVTIIKNKEHVEYDNLPEDSPKAITDKIINNIEANKNITIHNLTGSSSTTSEKVIKDKIDKSVSSKDEKEDTKDKLVDEIKKKSEENPDIESTAEDIANDEEIMNLIAAASVEEKKISTQRQNRINSLEQQLMTKSIKGQKVKDLLEVNNDQELEKTSLKIDSINEDWQNITFNSFDKTYNVDADIVAMLHSLSKMSYPIYIKDINVQDTSTSEDRVETYTVQMEDLNGKRFTVKFDIPIMEEGYMVLRGNRKTISNQLFLKPLIETDEDVVQIVSNYNKIFVKRYGKVTGKSIVYADKIIKTFNKLENRNVKITYGDNSKICSKYALPIDYIDLASYFDKIEYRYPKGGSITFYFNQSEILELYKDKIDNSKGIPFGYDSNTKSILYYNSAEETFSQVLLPYLYNIDKFHEIYHSTKGSSRYTYSKASILNTDIPVVIVCAYSEGLESTLRKASIEYVVTEKKAKEYVDKGYDFIKFSDGYLFYKNTYSSSLLMNGLKESPTDLYSITEINNKGMYVDFLENYGGRLKADGLDNFYDLMIDEPITTSVLEHYGYPTDYIELLIYASNLLADNNFNRHIDMDGKRLRRKEIISGYFYKALSESYKSYSLELKHGRSNATLFIKQSAVIDKLMEDPTQQDTSLTSVLLDAEYSGTVSTKGLSGMNSDRSYSLDKRTYDESMQNVIAMATGFAGNVGVTRQLTIDANISNNRGYINIDTDPEHISTAKTYCYTEALTPFGVTHDDPFRSAMTFVQTSKHNVRVNGASPMLITNGTDEAIPYLTSNVFSYKAKQNGVIKEITEDYMIVEYDDKTHDYIDLSERIEKNSNSGSYVTIKLDTDLKVGKKIKANEIIAYDRLSFDRSIGPTDNLAYSGTVLAKCALMQTDEGFEDSAIVSDKLCERLATEIVFKKDVYIPASTNVYNLVKIGQHVQEGENLLVMQTPYEEEEANRLLKYLADDEDAVSDLGRIPIKSKITGMIQDIRISRTVELSEMSDSLKKICTTYEKDINKKKNVMKKYKIDKEYTLDPTYKLNPVGKLKNCPDGVLLEIFLKEHVKFGVGETIQ